jgi:pimeloyl-ACP methyl ester carboxylesterase
VAAEEGWAEGEVRVDGARIHYYRRGAGPALVLAHGSGDNGLCWGRVAAVFGEQYDVIAYDARNHGESAAFEVARAAADRMWSASLKS